MCTGDVRRELSPAAFSILLIMYTTLLHYNIDLLTLDCIIWPELSKKPNVSYNPNCSSMPIIQYHIHIFVGAPSETILFLTRLIKSSFELTIFF